jgi:hypothetical protein
VTTNAPDPAANILALILHKAGMEDTGADEYAQLGQAAIDRAAQPSAAAPVGAEATAGGTTSGTSSPVPAGTPVNQAYGGEHGGIDLGVPAGTSVSAAISGKVITAADSGDAGNLVEIQGPDGTVTRYMHLSNIGVTVGATVKAGQSIGKSGGVPGAPGAGHTTGAHLHFEVRQGGATVDPTPWLAGGAQIVNAAPGEIQVHTADPAGIGQAILDKAAGKPSTYAPETTTDPTQPGAMTGADNDAGAVDAFLNAIKQKESGGDYTIRNTSGESNAAGAYQFIGTTWKGLGGSTASAAEASPAEQDRIARAYALQLFQQFKSWRLVALAWYGGPGVAEQAARGQDPGAPARQGRYLDYANSIVTAMSGGK